MTANALNWLAPAGRIRLALSESIRMLGWIEKGTGMAGRHRLSAAYVRSAPSGKHCDGGGLWLHRRPDGGAQWVLRVTVHGRRREMGLRSLSNVSLKKAREFADHWRALAASGTDPIKERERQAREAARADNTLRKIAIEAFEARKAELKGDGRPAAGFPRSSSTSCLNSARSRSRNSISATSATCWRRSGTPRPIPHERR